MKAITIRHVDAQLARALERETRRRGASLNATVLELLRQSLGVDDGGARTNGLRRLSGGWSDEERVAFEGATAIFGQVDAELWS